MNSTPSLIRAIFSPIEIAYCRIKLKPAEHFAARYATKEAGFKACGYRYRDITVNQLPDGKPTVVLKGDATERAKLLNAGLHLLSLSYSHDYAVAQLIVLQAT
ncbi:hypothetical protein A3B39_03665 [Candidatus Daviesbacteria bacterium RIFCSPLOWO2_01_FULL_37_10]|nr:MAG: hypothetical protein A3B39_03665 [Candidatus Daviesbacteria bacterium RIFCSPLOWO2_01_FULL_37_10]